MTREELIEAMVRRMAESECGPTSLYGYASAALAALEAAGVRLVPVDPDDNQLAAGMESDSIAHPWEALGVYRMMLSRSPYTLKVAD